MDAALLDLEKKIAQLVAVVQQLRSENRVLRQQLLAKADEAKRLVGKIETAKARLDTLIKQLPETSA